MLNRRLFNLRCLLAVAATGCLCLSLVAQESAGSTTSSAATNSPGAPSTGPGDLNLKVSRVFTFVDKTGLGHQHAVEGKLVSGKLLLGARSEAGELVFDMKSFDADTDMARRYLGLSGSTDESTRSKVNANMKSEDVLDVGRYPTATFKISSAVATGDTGSKGLPVYRLIGDFTLHGVTRPQVVTAEVEQSRGWLHVRGDFVVKQTSFGITPFSKAFGAIGVADALRIYGDLWVAPNDQVAMNAIPQRQ